MFANIKGKNIFFDVDGQSVEVKGDKVVHKPVIFVVHGGPGGNHLGFKPNLDKLTHDAQLVYIDQRGCGYSEEDRTDHYTLEQNVEDIEALRQYLGLDKIWILGHSYGGMVAMSYGIKYQAHLEGLILATTSPSYQFLEKAKRYVEEHGNADQIYYSNKLWEGNFQSEEEVGQYYKVMQPLYSVSSKEGKPPKKPETKRSYKVLNKGFGSFLRSFDLRPNLLHIEVPTLILAGRHDWITPVSENEDIHQRIPNSTFHVLENSSHSVFIDENKLTLSLISEFLSKHSLSTLKMN